MLVDFLTRNLEPILKARESMPSEGEGLTGLVYPPVSLNQILGLTYSNAFHTQCISLEAEMSIGLEYEAPKTVENFLEGISGDQDTFLDLLAMFTWDWECLGNGYLEVARSRKGQIGELYHVHAQTVYPSTNGNRLSEYVQETTNQVRFSPFGTRDGNRNELFHIKRYTPLSTYYGLPEWVACMEALRLDQEKKTFYAAFFKNFAVPALAVVLEGAEFDEAVEKKLQAGFNQMKGAENAFRALMLSIPFEGATVRFEKLMADFKDLPFDQLTQATREEILAAHGVPPRLVGIITAGSLGGGGEAEGQLLNFIATKIEPRTKFLERKVKLLLRDAGLPEEFTLKGIRPVTPKELSPEEQAAAEKEAIAEVLKSLNRRGGF